MEGGKHAAVGGLHFRVIQACVFDLRLEHCPPYMDSDVTQSTAFYNFLAWVEVNKKRLLGWGGVIAAIAGITSIFLYSQVRKEESASRALSEVRAGPGPSSLPPQDLAGGTLLLKVVIFAYAQGIVRAARSSGRARST